MSLINSLIAVLKANNQILRYLTLGAIVVAILVSIFMRRPNANIKAATPTVSAGQNIVEVNGSTPEELAKIRQIAEQVTPDKGFTILLKWGDLGKKLVDSRAIDVEKYGQIFSTSQEGDLLSYLTDQKKTGITINKNNARFWVNTLWALGLTQRSNVLRDMRVQYPNVANLAGTGGWTLGVKDAMALYDSVELISLTEAQQTLVAEISKNIYRPCCNNPTSFPDCNHGMAALGLIEIMVGQNFSEAEIYKTILVFNAYWFPQTYVDLAYYFATKQNISWEQVDPQLVLGSAYSSAQGYKNIKQQVGVIPGVKSPSSCGV